MPKTIDSYNILYAKIAFNEDIYNSELGNRIGVYKKLKFNIFVLVLLSYILINKLYFLKKEKVVDGDLGIVWNKLHLKKINSLRADLKVLNIQNSVLLKKQSIGLFRKASVFKILKTAWNIKGVQSDYNYDSFFYRVYVVLMFEMLDDELKTLNNIYISGHFDRLTTLIAETCIKNKIDLNIIQHGCVQIFKKNLIKNKITGNVFYTYDFSVTSFNSFLNLGPNSNLIKFSIKNEIDFVKLDCDKPVIVYGCQDVLPVNNILIIDYLLETFKDHLVYVIPHPRENTKFYKKKYGDNQMIKISRDKPINVEVFISRFSTLGIQYQKEGVRTVFINLDKVNMDFIFSKNYEVYNNLYEFKK